MRLFLLLFTCSEHLVRVCPEMPDSHRLLFILWWEEQIVSGMKAGPRFVSVCSKVLLQNFLCSGREKPSSLSAEVPGMLLFTNLPSSAEKPEQNLP